MPRFPVAAEFGTLGPYNWEPEMRFAPMKATPRGLWRRTPPAIFAPTLGLLGLGLGWRRAAAAYGLPPGLPEMALGAVVLLAAFALLAYAGKALRRPGVVLEDLRILPGRAGLSAGVLCLYLMALALGPLAGGAARGLLAAGMVAQLALSAAVLRVLATGPAAQRRVSPDWHLLLSGWIVAAMAAQGLGLPGLALPLFWASLLCAAGIWLASIAQFAREGVPAPLRPLLAIHLSPMALLGTVAQGFGATGIALSFGALSAVLALALLLSARWLTAAGFTALWGAFTFPLAATAGLWIALGWAVPGAIALSGATLAIVPIAFRIYKLWAGGQLAVKTNAAIA